MWQCKAIAESNAFSYLIIICILLAAGLVGMQTIPNLEGNKILSLLDEVLLYIFASECLLKMLAEGPRSYSTGPEWRWNMFDFTIVLLCMPFFHLGDGGDNLLRLLRLLRVIKLIKEVPQLEILVGGLAKGVASIPYTTALILLIFYIFAVAAVFLFGANDPAQFGDLGVAFITLFRCATLEDWTDVMYINMFGCDVYGGGLYTWAESNHPVHSVFGTFKGFQCTAPSRRWVLSVAYFVCFIIFSACVLLSLFIGAITMGMSEAVEAVRIQELAEDNLETVDPDWFKELVDRAFLDPAGKKHEESRPSPNVPENNREEKSAPMDGMGSGLLRSPSSVSLLEEGRGAVPPLRAPRRRRAQRVWWGWSSWSRGCARLAEHPWFQGAVLAAAAAAAALVGLSTRFENTLLTTLDNAIIFVFVVELVIVYSSNPLCFFKDTWNVLDFIIVASSTIFMLLTPMQDIAKLIRVLWLLRILRAMRLVRSLPRLRILIEVLMDCFVSLAYLCVLMLLVFFVFAVLGMMMFQTNDPWHYGTLQSAVLTLFRISTLEDWTDVMFINQYGCDVYGWQVYPALSGCAPRALGYWSVLYHTGFVALATLVLTNTFLGAVVTSMLQAERAQRREKQLDRLAQRLAKQRGMPLGCVKTLQKGFLLFDLDYGGSIDVMEVFPLFLALCPDATDEQLADLFLAVEKDDSGSIDFDEFIELVLLLRNFMVDGSAEEDALTPILEFNNDGTTGSFLEREEAKTGPVRNTSASRASLDDEVLDHIVLLRGAVEALERNLQNPANVLQGEDGGTTQGPRGVRQSGPVVTPRPAQTRLAWGNSAASTVAPERAPPPTTYLRSATMPQETDAGASRIKTKVHRLKWPISFWLKKPTTGSTANLKRIKPHSR